MSIQWPNIGLFGEFENCESGILDKLNQNQKILDALVQATVTDRVADQAGLPASAPTGTKYIADDDGTVWLYTDQWEAITPQNGWIAYDQAASQSLVFSGGQWEPLSSVFNFASLGTGEPVFAQVNPTTGVVEFKSIRAGAGILVSSNADEITIQTSGVSNLLPLNWYPDGLTTNVSNVVDDPGGPNTHPLDLKTVAAANNQLTANAYELDTSTPSPDQFTTVAKVYFQAPVPASFVDLDNDPLKRYVVMFNVDGSVSATFGTTASYRLSQRDATDTEVGFKILSPINRQIYTTFVPEPTAVNIRIEITITTLGS